MKPYVPGPRRRATQARNRAAWHELQAKQSETARGRLNRIVRWLWAEAASAPADEQTALVDQLEQMARDLNHRRQTAPTRRTR